MKTIPNPAKFLLESGLLFLINKDILHPFGLALSVNVDDDGTVNFGKLLDVREEQLAKEDPGFLFTDKLLEECTEKYHKFLDEQGEALIMSRQEQLGYVIQGDEEDDQ